MSLRTKPKIAILTIRNTYNYGGVFSTLKVAYDFCEKYFQPTVFFLGFDKEISANLRSFNFSSKNRSLIYFGMNCVEIGSRWAFWEPGHYAYTLAQWKQALAGYDYFFVVSATPLAAHPLVSMNKKFPIWISTPYNQDRTERVKELSGIRLIINKLAHKRMNAIEKLILEKASFIWALSKYSRQQFETILQHPKKNIAICGYPIACRKEACCQTLKENAIIAIGRFSDPRKNITMLMQVFDKLYQTIPDLKLYVIGKQPPTDKLTPFVNQESFNNIVFTGQVSPADLKLFYNKASLMLITSYQEGFGIAGLEALTHGIPIISTDCGGIKDFVINDFTGYIVKVNDTASMVEKSLQILSSPDVHKKMSQAGRKFAQENFSQERIYSIFKHGLSTVYPDLAAWFTQCDATRAQEKTFIQTTGYDPSMHNVVQGTRDARN